MGILHPFLGLLLSLPRAAAVVAADRGGCHGLQLSHHRHQCRPSQVFPAKKESVMTADRRFVLVAGLALIADIVWFFWLKRSTGARAAQASGGYQEVMILV